MFCLALYLLGFSAAVLLAFSLSYASEAPFLALCKNKIETKA